jgi:hypothetical protein
MALEMLEMKIRLVAVGALVLALRIFSSIGGRLSRGRRWPTGVRRQNTAASLLSDDM